MMHPAYELKGQESFVGPAKIVLVHKICGNCGKLHVRVPARGVENERGFWWNCCCKSTLLHPKNNNQKENQ